MKKLVLALLLTILYTACTDDFLDNQPSNYAQQTDLFATKQGVNSALIGCYSDFQNFNYYGRNFVLIGDIYADNAKLSAQNIGNFSSFYNISVTNDDEDLKAFWSIAYKIINNANNIIKACQDTLRNDLNETIYGEALAVRSLAYFDLVRIFANKSSFSTEGIPLACDTIPYPSRTSVRSVYAQIISDLRQAETLLEDAEVTPFRFNKYSVKALLTLVYVSDNQRTNAIETAENFIATNQYSLLTADNYMASWSQESSTESIFSIAMSATDNPGTNSIGHMLSPDGYGGVIPSEDLLSLYSSSDIRTSFIKKRSEKFFIKYPGREGLGVDNIPVLRLSEIYFVLADCYLVKMMEVTDVATQASYYEKALAIMEKLTKRVDASCVLDNLSATDLYMKVHEEYRKEFAFEGKRFFQLKRSVFSFGIERNDCNSKVCSVPNPSYLFAFPIPTAELNANSNLTQNQGY